jgi:hypothetical protein
MPSIDYFVSRFVRKKRLRFGVNSDVVPCKNVARISLFILPVPRLMAKTNDDW